MHFISSMEEEGKERELQLLLPMASLSRLRQGVSKNSVMSKELFQDHPSLDLNLSISIGQQQQQQRTTVEGSLSNTRSVQALKQHTAEQIRLAAVEREYAERVRELTKRELEMAEKEFARARLVWERARQEMEKVERMKELATRRINPSCIEITCQACRQRFRPF